MAFSGGALSTGIGAVIVGLGEAGIGVVVVVGGVVIFLIVNGWTVALWVAS